MNKKMVIGNFTKKLIAYKKRIHNVCRRWKGQWIYFSPKIAIGDFLCTTLLRGTHSKLKHNIIEHYYMEAQNIVEQRYSAVIDKWQEINNTCENIKENDPIFIFWWQGINSVPDIVHKCIENIKKHAGEHPIILIDQNNFHLYANIPEYIINKVNNGLINFTLFSDILRCCLLYENGGIWIDSTCFMTKNFTPDIYKKKFYTIKHGDSWDFPICRGYWATFFLAASKKNPLVGFMREFFFEFWKKEKAFIVYLSIDLFLSIAYDNFSWAKEVIDDVPYNNKHRDDLRNTLIKNKGKGFNEIIKKVNSDTYIHKLTYKMYIEDIDKI